LQPGKKARGYEALNYTGNRVSGLRSGYVLMFDPLAVRGRMHLSTVKSRVYRSTHVTLCQKMEFPKEIWKM
jgi:hypothetical protein